MSVGGGDRKRGKGLFLDLDGTLADSLGLLREVYECFLEGFGKQPTDAEFQNLNGAPLGQIIAALQHSHSLPGDSSHLKVGYLALIEDAHRKAPPAKGALELVAKARQRGWTLAVVTSAHRVSARGWLDANGILPAIAELVCGEEVAHAKPNSEPYRLALARTNCDPRRSMAVEDSRAGAASAVAAGLTTFALAAEGDRAGWPPGIHFLTGLQEMLEQLDDDKD